MNVNNLIYLPPLLCTNTVINSFDIFIRNNFFLDSHFKSLSLKLTSKSSDYEHGLRKKTCAFNSSKYSYGCFDLFEYHKT